MISRSKFPLVALLGPPLDVELEPAGAVYPVCILPNCYNRDGLCNKRGYKEGLNEASSAELDVPQPKIIINPRMTFFCSPGSTGEKSKGSQ